MTTAHRRKSFAVAACVAGIAIATGLATQPGPSNAAPVPSAASAPSDSAPSADDRLVGDLRIQDKAGVLSGRYSVDDSTITFTARRTSSTGARVRIDVNGTPVTARRDLADGTARWGAGGATLSRTDLRAVRGFSRQLADRWVDPAGTRGQGIGLRQDLTLRLVMLTAEGAPGLKLKDRAAPRTKERQLERTPEGLKVVPTTDGTATDSCLADVLATTRPGSHERKAALRPCNQGNEDGIAYFGSCSTISRWIVHDAASHCLQGESLSAGPRSSECLGECGPSCNGLNIYTYDCADHDRCGRVHGGSLNPWDAECGDEYFEADDDFLWGWPNCS